MTLRQAQDVASSRDMVISNYGDEYVVRYREDGVSPLSARVTHDLDEAAQMAIEMRKERSQEQAGDIVF